MVARLALLQSGDHAVNALKSILFRGRCSRGRGELAPPADLPAIMLAIASMSFKRTL